MEADGYGALGVVGLGGAALGVTLANSFDGWHASFTDSRRMFQFRRIETDKWLPFGGSCVYGRVGNIRISKLGAKLVGLVAIELVTLAEHNFGFIRSVLEDIEADLPDGEEYQIVADAVDGYNPVHDLASAMGVALQRRLKAKGKITSLYFSAAVPAAVPGASGKSVFGLDLDDAAKDRKLKALGDYAPLAEEARRILEQDKTAINREYMIDQDTDWSDGTIPHWEKIGRERVKVGTYSSCLTYKEHFQPIVLDLLEINPSRTTVSLASYAPRADGFEILPYATGILILPRRRSLLVDSGRPAASM